MSHKKKKKKKKKASLTCDITIEKLFGLNFTTDMYQRTFKECELYK